MAGRNTSPFFWSSYDDERLLGLRLGELGLGNAVDGFAPASAAIAELRRDLRARNLRVDLHFWWAREWFTPDGVPGIALPFYLAHRRLTRLERRLMHGAEGASPASLRKILRHEAGHAVMNAFALRRHPEVRALFGPSETPYPTSYRPRLYSRRFVRHLPGGYAQSHPDEDFAETFAVWLGGRRAWRRRYAGWPVLTKLEGLDQVMRSLAGKRPPVRSERRVEPLDREHRTLRQHYAERRRHFRLVADRRLDRRLRRAFPAPPAGVGGHFMTAERFLRKIKENLAREAVAGSHLPRYEADRLLEHLIRRARELGLRIAPGEARRLQLEARLTAFTRRLLQADRPPIFM